MCEHGKHADHTKPILVIDAFEPHVHQLGDLLRELEHTAGETQAVSAVMNGVHKELTGASYKPKNKVTTSVIATATAAAAAAEAASEGTVHKVIAAIRQDVARAIEQVTARGLQLEQDVRAIAAAKCAVLTAQLDAMDACVCASRAKHLAVTKEMAELSRGGLLQRGEACVSELQQLIKQAGEVHVAGARGAATVTSLIDYEPLLLGSLGGTGRVFDAVAAEADRVRATAEAEAEAARVRVAAEGVWMC